MTLQLVIGGTFICFFIAATFWAGATYNRIQAIENALLNVTRQLGELTHVAVLKMQMEGVSERLDRLERFHS